MKNKKFVLVFIIGTILFSGISVYAATTYLANNIIYKDNKTVETALDELYSKSDSNDIMIPMINSSFYSQGGGSGDSNVKTNGLNTLTIGSRTVDGSYNGTVNFDVNGYLTDDCSGTLTSIFHKTDFSSTMETVNISNYKCLKFNIYVSRLGTSGNSWLNFSFNNVHLFNK